VFSSKKRLAIQAAFQAYLALRLKFRTTQIKTSLNRGKRIRLIFFIEKNVVVVVGRPNNFFC
jgi:hypothetical protein